MRINNCEPVVPRAEIKRYIVLFKSVYFQRLTGCSYSAVRMATCGCTMRILLLSSAQPTMYTRDSVTEE